MYISISSDITNPTSKSFTGNDKGALLDEAILFLQNFLPNKYSSSEPVKEVGDRGGERAKDIAQPSPSDDKDDRGKHKGQDKKDEG